MSTSQHLIRTLYALLGFVFALALVDIAFAEPAQRLFVITRSKNSNALHYDVRLDRRGKLEQNPLDVYWVMHEQRGRREAPTWLEKKLAYGWQVVSARPDGFLLKLVAFDKRILRVDRKTGRFRASVAIGGRASLLERIHVNSREGGLVPKVSSIELFGTDASGKAAYEKIAND